MFLRFDVLGWLEKKYKLVLVLLVLISFLVGGMEILVKPIDLEGGQTPSWWAVIQNVETGRGYKACVDNYVPNCELTDQVTAMREPLPILLFALVARLSKDSVLVFQLVQQAIFTSILLVTFLLGREVGGVLGGLFAGFMWTFDFAALHLQTMITGDLLATLFIALGFLKFVQVIRHNRWSDWLQFGLFFALASLSRSAAMILVGTLGIGYVVYVYMLRRRLQPVPSGWLVKAASAASAFVFILGIWVARNWMVFHSPIIGTTLQGYVFYRHNAIVADNVPPHYVGPDEALQLVQKLALKHPELVSSSLPEPEISKIFMEEAVALVKAHPLNYVKLYFYRFIPLWFNIGLREQYGERMILTDYIIVIQQALLLLLIPLGLRKRSWTVGLIASSLLVSIMIYLGIEGQLRYMVPITPEVLVIAALGMKTILDRYLPRSV